MGVGDSHESPMSAAIPGVHSRRSPKKGPTNVWIRVRLPTKPAPSPPSPVSPFLANPSCPCMKWSLSASLLFCRLP